MKPRNNEQAIQQITDLTSMKAQAGLLNKQNSQLLNNLIRYSEIIGQVLGAARPVVSRYEELAQEAAGVPGIEPVTDDVLIAFIKELAKVLTQLTVKEEPKDGAQQEAAARGEAPAQEGEAPGREAAGGGEAPPSAPEEDPPAKE